MNRARLFGLLAALAVAATGLGAGQVSYLCHMTGEVTHACCCEGEHRSESPAPVVEQPDCCQVLKAHTAAAPSGLREAAQRVPAVAWVQLYALALESLRTDDRQSVELPPLPPLHPPGPPRFLVHCAFLI